VHLALGRGLLRAAERAGEIGATTVQVFVDNPAAWRRRNAPPRHLEAFRARLAELEVVPVAVHAAYLVNLAGPDPAFRASSIDILAADMLAAVGYSARFVNVHTGSHRDTSVEAGMEGIATGIVEVLDRVGDVPDAPVLVLENAAGGGFALGTTVEELAAILERTVALGVPERRLAVCLDTAHLWGAGYDISTADGATGVVDRFDELLGIERLTLVHLNDSRSELASRADRHEHVGAGRIGPAGLGALLRDPRLLKTTFVMETPGTEEGWDAVNVRRAWQLWHGASDLPVLPPKAFKTNRRASRLVS
jgi:deoxyribonuclease-4